GALALALSGGKDSLTLLFLLNAILKHHTPSLALVALHVGGAFSCGASVDQHFIQSVCDALEVPLRIQTTEGEPTSCYPCSRRRRSLLFEAAKDWGASTIAFGHHRDDNSETLFLNLLHKGEFAGMLPSLQMHRYDITLIRPLIYASEEEITAFAQKEGFLRTTCRCPIGQKSKRREVKQAIQRLKNAFPNIENNLSHASLSQGSDKAGRPLS
ncbi:MAG: tRNA 2-thiocytidine biosynthesis TtcA family protein, partial [Chlamydiota bacterium]|nr:tRNA 2-thiocytidine biosynthesis TtcA family protein [Chlamydiota bacterium]